MSVLADFRNGSNKRVAVSYLFTSHRKGAAGSSVTSQRGKVEVKSKGVAILSTLRINVSPRDSYFIELATFLDGRLVGRDSVECRWN